MIRLLLGMFACSGDGEGHIHGHFGNGTADAATKALPKGSPFLLSEIARVKNPTALVEPPAGPEGLWATEQAGTIVRIGAGGVTSAVIDIENRITDGGERGLLGLAFHPKWPDDPRAFVNYTYTDDAGLNTRIASFSSRDGGLTLDAASEVTVMSFVQPWSNHNSGSLAFGSDGMLYIGVGDGGSGGDPRGTGQDRRDLLGSILRVDVATAPYAIPPDNPFVGKSGVRGEIWAYGVRNPWGMHFDGDTLWFADVGQNAWEEVDRGVRGGNYGWNAKEGTRCFERDECAGDYVEPVAEYPHSVGTSVTGGFVYRGPSIPALDGKYVFADFTKGRFFAVAAAGGELENLVEAPMNPSTFGRDRRGRMYVADYSSGAVLRLEAP